MGVLAGEVIGVFAHVQPADQDRTRRLELAHPRAVALEPVRLQGARNKLRDAFIRLAELFIVSLNDRIVETAENAFEPVEPQLMPDGALVTVPEPVPAFRTWSVTPPQPILLGLARARPGRLRKRGRAQLCHHLQ